MPWGAGAAAVRACARVRIDAVGGAGGFDAMDGPIRCRFDADSMPHMAQTTLVVVGNRIRLWVSDHRSGIGCVIAFRVSD